MDQTPNLELPYIMAAQAQKHVTHNEAIRALDAVVHLAVIDRNQNTPPASPANGDRYIVAPSPFGDWADQAHNIAAFQDGAWSFYKPQIGWTTWVADETLQLVWDGSAWAPTASSSASVNPTPLVGVNATADTTNRFALSSEAALLKLLCRRHDNAVHFTQLKALNKFSRNKTWPISLAQQIFNAVNRENWSPVLRCATAENEHITRKQRSLHVPPSARVPDTPGNHRAIPCVPLSGQVFHCNAFTMNLSVCNSPAVARLITHAL